ncbi:MAG: GNAT family N-acetyltransferase [Culicoidibacterales bacterium]
MRTQSPRLELVSVNSTFFDYFDLTKHGAHIQTFTEQLNENPRLDGLGPWLIFLKNTHEIIGDTGVKKRLDEQTLEISIEIFQEYRGHNYGAEAIIAFRQFACSKNIHYLVARVSNNNIAAQRLFERANFIRQETQNDVTTYRYVNLNWIEKIEDQSN